MADTPISALPVANNDDTLSYAGVQGSITKQIPGVAALAQMLRDLGYTPAPINSPVFTGDPRAPTPALGDNDTSISTTAFVTAAINLLITLVAPASIGINNQTGTAYTLVIGDANTVVKLSNAAAITLTVPANADVAFPIGTPVYFMQGGAGQVTVAPAGGVSVLNAASLTARAQNSFLGLVKLATDTWVLYGDMT